MRRDPTPSPKPRWRCAPSLAETVGLLVIALTTFVVGFAPLFGGPGYEYALACGLILPGCVAVTAALTELNRDRLHRYSSALGRGALVGMAASVLAALTAGIHGLRVGFCSPTQGFTLFLLGPAAGALLAGVWGAVVGSLLKTVAGKKRIAFAIVLGLAAPVATIVISLLRFYTSPMIFAFDPFVGFFAGALYDTVIGGLDRLLTYRVGSAATLLAVWAAARQLRVPGPGQRWPRWRWRHWSNAALLLVGGLVSSTITLNGPRLGHYQTAKSIATTLGGQLQGERCEVLHSREMLVRDVALLTRECDAHVRAIESFLGTQGPKHVRVYLFNGPDQKGWLMGAANTYIAKPWRNEIYLQAAGFPHPVLAHELAHVIAGSFGRGPFKIAGDWGGWLPDPGRIEGIAVAAAPSDEADLTATEWAAAMLELRLLPSFDAVFGLGFLAQHSSTAYTVAGAFLQHLREQLGPEVLQAWYGGQTLEQATGVSLAVWEQRFRAHLATIQLAEAALNNAR
ncbi:MAG TPA: hypothetical protein VHO25_07595, partial [Polyangiaceae bacterium]|nr:hypothetical protein [Polyangiaceae bacterium]